MRKFQEITSRLMERAGFCRTGSTAEGRAVLAGLTPPELPEKPDRPNRLAILLLGAFLAIAGGVGTGVVADNVDRRIFTVDQLGRAMRGWCR